MTLDELAIKYGTDKSSLFHNYCIEYEVFLKKYVDNPITLLEIGPWKGYSIQMWLDYFPLAKIIGVDQFDQSSHIKNDRYQFILGNQTDIKSFSNFSNIDIVIDDGSHHGIDQKQTFEMLFNRLNSGGLYIVEDISTSYWSQFGDFNFISYSTQYINSVNYYGMYNDVPTDICKEGYKMARSSKYLEETLRLKKCKRLFDIKSIYYGNSFIIFFKS